MSQSRIGQRLNEVSILKPWQLSDYTRLWHTKNQWAWRVWQQDVALAHIINILKLSLMRNIWRESQQEMLASNVSSSYHTGFAFFFWLPQTEFEMYLESIAMARKCRHILWFMIKVFLILWKTDEQDVLMSIHIVLIMNQKYKFVNEGVCFWICELSMIRFWWVCMGLFFTWLG